MKKEKKDAYLKLLLAEHPDWVENRDPYHTLCTYLSFGDFEDCIVCTRVDDCCAYRVFEIRSDYDELYDCVERLKTRLAGTKTGRSFDWDLLLELMAQDKKLEIENCLPGKLALQIERAEEKEEPANLDTGMEEDGYSSEN